MNTEISHLMRPYPHPAACAECRALRLCDVCGNSALSPCTNGRCRDCHAVVCTPGGETGPGHGYGTRAAAQKRAYAAGPGIYQQMVNAGVKIDSHASDLYVPVNEITRAIVAGYASRSGVTIFTSQTDGKQWYDIPFAYKPFWDAKTR